MNMITNFLRVANNMVRPYEMMFSHEITALEIFFRSSLSDSKPNMPNCWYIGCTAAQFRGINTLIVKYLRRRVWETRRSGATGWEVLSHFSDVWRSSLLQLTRGSNWQRESLFRCQMWPHWMYVSYNIIRKGNELWITWCHIIVRVPEFIIPQR
jgi:hypothetical protein